jgi:hypothetical protein
VIAESTACREAALAGRLAFLNTGSLGAAAARLYGDPRPASADGLPASAMLVEIPLHDPAGVVADGALTLLPRDPGMIVHSGLATWVRFVNRDGATGFDLEAGETGSGIECDLTTTTLWAGGVVAITSAVLG